MSEKEKLIQYINEFVDKDQKRNVMGCSENWYIPEFCLMQTFTLDEIDKMDENEISNLLRLAQTIGEGLY